MHFSDIESTISSAKFRPSIGIAISEIVNSLKHQFAGQAGVDALLQLSEQGKMVNIQFQNLALLVYITAELQYSIVTALILLTSSRTATDRFVWEAQRLCQNFRTRYQTVNLSL
jgi:hypothetical protein